MLYTKAITSYVVRCRFHSDPLRNSSILLALDFSQGWVALPYMVIILHDPLLVVSRRLFSAGVCVMVLVRYLNLKYWIYSSQNICFCRVSIAVMNGKKIVTVVIATRVASPRIVNTADPFCNMFLFLNEKWSCRTSSLSCRNCVVCWICYC